MSENGTLAVKTARPTPRRWDPFERFSQMEREMDRFLGDRWPLRRVTDAPGTWMPSTDVYEQNGSIVVTAELPGMKKEDIEVEVQDGHLVIRGERRAEEKVEEKDYYRMERSFGSFYRRLPLPKQVEPDQIRATFEDGVLKVTVPKPVSTEPEPKKVPIQ